MGRTSHPSIQELTLLLNLGSCWGTGQALGQLSHILHSHHVGAPVLPGGWSFEYLHAVPVFISFFSPPAFSFLIPAFCLYPATERYLFSVTSDLQICLLPLSPRSA